MEMGLQLQQIFAWLLAISTALFEITTAQALTQTANAGMTM